MIKFEKGKHKSWRELGFRIHKSLFLDYDETYIEFNLWKYFLTIVVGNINKD